MPTKFRTTRRVEFRDTDAAGIAHFTAFFAYMEQAEHELLRHLGLSVMMHDTHGKISWPRVAVNCEFFDSVKFEDIVEVEVGIERMGEKSVTYVFHFLRNGQKLAQGKITAVCCRIVENLPPKSIPIPDHIRQKLAAAAP